MAKLTTNAKAYFVEAARSVFEVDQDVAEVIAEIIHEEFDNLNDKLKEFEEEIEESKPVDALAELYSLVVDHLNDLTLNENGGYTGSLYELEQGNTSYQFCTLDEMEEEAHGQFDSLIDEMLHEAEWVKNHVVPSWERGQTRKEFVEEGVRIDGPAHFVSHYDGDYTEVKTSSSGVYYSYWRNN
jgi:hypothetical protein